MRERLHSTVVAVVVLSFLAVAGLIGCAGEASEQSQSKTETEQQDHGHSHGDEGHSHGEEGGHEH